MVKFILVFTRTYNEIVIIHHRLEMFKNKTSYIGTKFISKLPQIGKEEKNPNIFKINLKKNF